jgi:PhzF family phenazine biosynthesis protein
MKLPIYQVDAFSERPFEGNPAAVVPLESWLPDALMQQIAEENNLAETAFFTPEGSGYRLRWFTPVVEVDLCGHATLASAAVLFERLGFNEPAIAFETRSGRLTVERDADQFWMDFPELPVEVIAADDAMADSLGAYPDEWFGGMDYFLVFPDEETVHRLDPDFVKLRRFKDRRGVIVTAPGERHDFVSRFFAPAAGISEDPVTGSAHCALAPFWASRLGKTTLQARQISRRGGDVACEVKGNRVRLGGRARFYLEGQIEL